MVNRTNGPTRPSAIAYHDALAREWTSRYRGRGFQRRLACFREIIRRSSSVGERWLDLGCGSGVLTAELLNCGASRVVAIDAAPRMLEYGARSVGDEFRNKVEWINADVEDTTFLTPGSFDGVLCSSVIEYVEHPAKVVRGIARVLRNGGRFVVSIPPQGSLVRALQKGVRWSASHLGRDVFSYLSVSRFEVDPDDVHDWLARFGLVTRRMTGFDPILPATIGKLLRPALIVLEGEKVEGT